MTIFAFLKIISLLLVPGAGALQQITHGHLNLKNTQRHASRREWLGGVITTVASAGLLVSNPAPASAIGPVKIDLTNPVYSAVPCPRDKPIPGEKAMKGKNFSVSHDMDDNNILLTFYLPLGLKGLCVTVDVDLGSSPEKPLEKIGTN